MMKTEDALISVLSKSNASTAEELDTLNTKVTFIYVLLDPRPLDATVYIGKSWHPEVRFYNHLKPSALKDATYKIRWLNKLKRLSLKPFLQLLDEVPAADWKLWERFYIQLFKDLGYKVTNATEGGDGLLPGVQLFLGHHHTEEAKRKISLANTGKTYPNRGLGVKKGPISLAASLHLSQLRKGIPKTPAYRKMMSRVLRGRQPKRAQLPQSGYRGVIWSEINKKWQVRIMYCGKTFYLGFYKDILDAAKVYNKASRKLFGKIAILNKLPSKENK